MPDVRSRDAFLLGCLILAACEEPGDDGWDARVARAIDYGSGCRTQAAPTARELEPVRQLRVQYVLDLMPLLDLAALQPGGPA
jgi:hypothetical protein